MNWRLCVGVCPYSKTGCSMYVYVYMMHTPDPQTGCGLEEHQRPSSGGVAGGLAETNAVIAHGGHSASAGVRSVVLSCWAAWSCQWACGHSFHRHPGERRAVRTPIHDLPAEHMWERMPQTAPFGVGLVCRVLCGEAAWHCSVVRCVFT